MVENRQLNKKKGKIPIEYATHSINIIYQNLNHDETLKHLKISLNVCATLPVSSSIWMLSVMEKPLKFNCNHIHNIQLKFHCPR